MVPSDLKYTRTHEWARLEGGIVTVGITQYAVEQLGDIVFLELPPSGKEVKREGPFGVVESVKAAVDLNCPVSGQVVESNGALTGSFDLLTGEPYGGGWMIKVKASNPAELDSLLTPQQYEELLKTESH